MASASDSTFARIAQHGPVTQALRAMRAPRAPDLYDGFGCVVLGGDVVFFDTHRRPATGEAALIIRRDGRLDVVPMEEQHPDRSPAVPGEGVIYVLKRLAARGAYRSLEQVVLIGAVRVSE